MKKILISTLAIVVCFGLTLATSRADDDPKDALQGVWECKSAESNGEKGPPEYVETLRLTIKGDKFFIHDGNKKTEDVATYTVDTKKTPHQIDLIPRNPPPTPKDLKILGIYQIKGDELKLCFGLPDGASSARPTEFTSKEGSGTALIVLKKVPVEKK